MFWILKSLHLIFAFTWFAALFYAPRLFIYQTEAQQLPEQEKNILTKHYKLLTKRLWYAIAWPSLVLNLIFGLGILFPKYTSMPVWLIVKLVLIAGLIGYHHLLHFTFKGLQNDVYKYTSHQLRVINEVATFFLFAIVFLGTMKTLVNFTYYAIGMGVLLVLLYGGILLYRKKRVKNE